MQLGSDYTSVAYVYDSNAAAGMTGNGIASLNSRVYLIGGPNDAHAAAYVGNDCIYSGAGDTNGTAVVAGDVARLAVNAIVGAVSNRVDMAYAASNSGASATDKHTHGMRNPRQRRQLHGREMKMWAIWRGPSGPTVQLSLRVRTGFLVETGLSLRLWSLADAVTAAVPEIKAL